MSSAVIQGETIASALGWGVASVNDERESKETIVAVEKYMLKVDWSPGPYLKELESIELKGMK